MPTFTGTGAHWRYPSGHTRKALRDEIAEVFGHHSGTATGGTAVTVVDSALTRFKDTHWVGAQVWIAQAAGAAPEFETAFVTGFTAATGELTLAPTLTAPVAVGDRYELFQVVTKDLLDLCLNRVCQGAIAIHSLTVVTDTLDYALASIDGLFRPSQVQAVVIRNQGNVLRQPVELTGWQIEDDRGVMTLRLRETPFASDELWLTYVITEDGLLSDDSVVNLPVQTVRARGMVWLLQNLLAKQSGTAFDMWGQQLQYWERVAVEAEHSARPRLRRTRAWPWNQSANPSSALAALGLTPKYY